MIFYKYRSLQNIEFILDIILNNKLYCAPYSELNDPFEGVFHSFSYTASYSVPWTMPLTATPNKVTKIKTIKDLLNEDTKASRICSLSTSLNDIRLWSHYADGNKGIAIEIEIPKTDLFEVKYLPGLAEFSDTLMTQTSSTDVLSIKTQHWHYESEYRVIQKDIYFPVAGNIKSIYLGHRISDFHKDLLKKIVPKSIPVIETELDSKTISIQPKA